MHDIVIIVKLRSRSRDIQDVNQDDIQDDIQDDTQDDIQDDIQDSQGYSRLTLKGTLMQHYLEQGQNSLTHEPSA